MDTPGMTEQHTTTEPRHRLHTPASLPRGLTEEGKRLLKEATSKPQVPLAQEGLQSFVQHINDGGEGIARYEMGESVIDPRAAERLAPELTQESLVGESLDDFRATDVVAEWQRQFDAAKEIQPMQDDVLAKALCDTFELKDSGVREQMDTGSQRDSREGKGRYDLIPYEPLRRLACVYEAGAAKYDDDNWRKGQPIKRFLDSAMRHTQEVLRGNEDEDHAAQAAWNLFGVIWTLAEIKAGRLPAELDDRWKG